MKHKLNAAERQIQKLFDSISTAEIEALAPDDDHEFTLVAEAVMAWYQLLLKSGIIELHGKNKQATLSTLGASLLILGTLVKTAYALGVRRGRQEPIPEET